MHQAFRLAAVGACSLLASVGNSACDGDIFGHACTLIGCDDALVVEVRGQLPAAFTVTVVSEGVPWTVDCSPRPYNATPCASGAWFPHFLPPRVAVEIRGDGLEWRSEELEPEYHTHRPNGKGCDPACRVGTVVVDVSG
jgi:hypothetical protein